MTRAVQHPECLPRHKAFCGWEKKPCYPYRCRGQSCSKALTHHLPLPKSWDESRVPGTDGHNFSLSEPRSCRAELGIYRDRNHLSSWRIWRSEGSHLEAGSKDLCTCSELGAVAERRGRERAGIIVSNQRSSLRCGRFHGWPPGGSMGLHLGLTLSLREVLTAAMGRR